MVKLDQGVADLVIKSIVAGAVGILGYVANSLVDRIGYLEKRAEDAKDRAHAIEIMMRAEFASKRELQEALARVESAIRERR